MPNLITLVDATVAHAIANETHVIGEDIANTVFLNELPDDVAAIVVTGSGGAPVFTKVASGPQANEFARVPGQSELLFNAADNGTTVEIDYDGTGSEFQARDWNRMHSKMQGIKTLTDAATVSLDFTDEWVNKVTLGGNRTVNVIGFPPTGAAVMFQVHQDVTGGRVITWDAGNFDFGTDGEPALTVTANQFDLLSFYSTGTVLKFLGFKGGFS